MRIAALSRISPQIDFEPSEVFRAVKDIYGYRSKVVHGQESSTKYSHVKIGGNEVLTIDFAIALLRKLILALGSEPKYLDPARIDDELLINSDGQNAKFATS